MSASAPPDAVLPASGLGASGPSDSGPSGAGCGRAGEVSRRIGEARPRRRIAVTGTIRSTGTVPFGSSFAYRCVLNDGSGDLDVYFLGRRSVTGLEVGTRCAVEGTVLADGGKLELWNPLYRIELGGRPEGSPAAATGTGGEATPQRLGGVPEVVRATVGHLRIYLGAAAGVGKTTAMLDEGRRLHDDGADVVIGLVETHSRPLTEARLADLEVIPRRVVERQGALLEEMDLDAIVRRRPEVVLVDELAHTNLPEPGRHEKRWQDVLDVLEAGIDVVTTLDVQHVESLADAVGRITGTYVRERVPDWVVRRADEIELVEASPERLRQRIARGSLYPAEQIPGALGSFFRTENLSLLRELARRFIANAPEEELADFLRVLGCYPKGA